MFGYHDSSDCSFDIWSPSRVSALENRAFSGYCKHMEECEEIISLIRQGYTQIQPEEDLDSGDLEYISKRLREYGIEATLNF